jgi:hypothetical protein
MTNPNAISNFEFMVLLALIRLGDEAYGVPISEQIEEHSGHEVAVGSVYAALDRLQGRGFVSSSWEIPHPSVAGVPRSTSSSPARAWKSSRKLKGR